jgi:DNA replication initiation complex subunit (GINS family)
MSLEQHLHTLSASVEANTVAIKALIAKLGTTATTAAEPAKTEKADKADKAETSKPTTTTKSTSKPKEDDRPKSEHTRQEMTAALNEVKEKFGAADAKAIIKSAGKVDKLAEIKDELIDAVYAAAKVKLDGEEAGGDEGDGL